VAKVPSGWHYVKICVPEGLGTEDFLIDADDSDSESISLGVFVKDALTGEPWAVDAYPIIPRVSDTICVGEEILTVVNVWLYGASEEVEGEGSRVEALVEVKTSLKRECGPELKSLADRVNRDSLNKLLGDEM
jgi:hypothetical protein